MLNRYLHNFLTCIDLNLALSWRPVFQEIRHVHRPNRLFTTYGINTISTLLYLRKTLRRQSKNFTNPMSRSLLHHGLRTTDPPTFSAGHRCLSAFSAAPLASHGSAMQKSISNNIGRCSGKTRLENLRRFGSRSSQPSSQALCRRTTTTSTRCIMLCDGFHNNRLVPFAFSMGTVSSTQGSDQTSHADESPRFITGVHLDNKRQGSRRKSHRPNSNHARFVLHFRPWLYGFCASLFNPMFTGIFRNSGQKESGYFGSRRPVGTAGKTSFQRSIGKAQRLQKFASISRCISAGEILRQREQSIFSVFNQRPGTTGATCRRPLQIPLGHRTVFSMDQTELENPGIFRHDSQCSQDANLDRNFGVCTYCNCQKTTDSQAEPSKYYASNRPEFVRAKAANRTLFRPKRSSSGGQS